jgi:hypothetical protein
MKIIIDVEEMGNKNEFIAEVEHFLKGGCMSGEVNENYEGMPTKFKWRIE